MNPEPQTNDHTKSALVRLQFLVVARRRAVHRNFARPGIPQFFGGGQGSRSRVTTGEQDGKPSSELLAARAESLLARSNGVHGTRCDKGTGQLARRSFEVDYWRGPVMKAF